MAVSGLKTALRDGWFRTGFLVALVLLTIALFGPALTFHDPHDIGFTPLSGPSAQHWLGVNDGGMDIGAELLYGLRNTLWFGLLGGTAALLLGIFVGLSSAWYGGWYDRFFMRLGDVLLAIPVVMPLILVAVLLRPSPEVIALLLAFFSWPTTAKGLRAQALAVRNRAHVRAAQRMGAGGRYIITRHLLPALFPLYPIGWVTKIRMAIFMEASLAFLGLFSPERKSLGVMIRDAIEFYYLDLWWHWLLPPVFCLTLMLMSLTFIAIGLEQTFDPRLKDG
jgi:peptide/nickel transport system permease protein